ncbi:MAG TPA: SGNH/GDSL hydrolase family protein [Clostridia bacterium]|nr:SGNH/GDSL hydrolase family protein [Clostridia bacterium]HPK17171.1 SGNH/GDSL hydrolase family protein [Clostridia bacterium]
MLQTIRAKIYGDSIMKGTVLDCAYRYHALFDRYFRRFAERFNIEVDNRSRFGITIDKGYKLLLQDIEAGMDADFALIEFGGNDSNFRWDEISRNPEGRHEPLTRVEHFREVVYTMIRELRGAQVRPVLMTLPPIDSEKYLSFLTRNGNDRGRILQWLGSPQVIHDFHERYSDAVAEIARETATPLVDARSRFLGRRDYEKLMCVDGVHPNEDGYELIAEAFSESVPRLLADYM